MEILSSKPYRESTVGHLVQIKIVKISPQISHVQISKDKYLMEDLSRRKRKEIRERKKESAKNGMGRKIMEKVERGRTEPSFGSKRDECRDRRPRSCQYSRTQSLVKCKFTTRSTDGLLWKYTRMRENEGERKGKRENCRCGIKFLLSVELKLLIRRSRGN